MSRIGKQPVPLADNVEFNIGADNVVTVKGEKGSGSLRIHPDISVKTEDGEVAKKITEVEAYNGVVDKACHASKGITERTEVMFGPPGYWYISLIYGIYDMLNIVTGPGKHPSAVLIRGVEEMDGPGILTRDLEIRREDFKNKKITPKNGLWIEDRGVEVERSNIYTGKRVGVDYAEEWAHKRWRFKINGV